MKESISITTIFQIFILFVLLFTAIMCLTINNSNAFGVKNEILNIIEANNGVYEEDNGNLSEDIIDTINETSYRTTGTCPDEYQGYQRNGSPVTSGQEASVCIRKVNVTSELDGYLEGELGAGTVATDDFVDGSYVQIVVFYQLDIPVIKQLYNFQTKGETRIIYKN